MTEQYDPAADGEELVGRKRARTEEGLKPEGLSNDEYLKELLEEKERHEKLQGADKMPHSERLVLAQIEFIRSGAQKEDTNGDSEENWNADRGDGIRTELASNEPTGVGSNVKAVLKIFIPEDVPDSRGSSTRGRLLGPKGSTIQRLHAESGCKMQIRGKGSVKFQDGSAPESHVHEEQYAHLAEDLHVSVQYEGPSAFMNAKFAKALDLVKTVVLGGSLQPAYEQYRGIMPYAGPGGGAGGFPGSAGLTGAASGWQVSSAAEVASAQQLAREGQIVSVVAANSEMGHRCSTTLKMFVPQKTSVGDSRGKLLGVRGATLRQLQQETGLRMSLRGKGSMRIPDGANETALIATDKYAHLKDQLHVVMEFEGNTAERDGALTAAQLLIRSMLTAVENAHPGQKHPMSHFEVLQHSHVPPAHQPYPPHYAPQHQHPPYHPHHLQPPVPPQPSYLPDTTANPLAPQPGAYGVQPYGAPLQQQQQQQQQGAAGYGQAGAGGYYAAAAPQAAAAPAFPAAHSYDPNPAAQAYYR